MSRNKHLCPCGSGKRAKFCCRPDAPPVKFGFTSGEKLELRQAAEAFAAKGKHQEAIEILERLVKARPHNPLIGMISAFSTKRREERKKRSPHCGGDIKRILPIPHFV